jgi:hypothetical protein
MGFFWGAVIGAYVGMLMFFGAPPVDAVGGGGGHAF